MQKHKHTTSSALLSDPTDLSEFDDLKTFVRDNEKIVSENSLRHQLRNMDENGLDACVVKVNGKFFIHRPSYLLWFANRNCMRKQ